jgi:hypothetical protein
MRSLAKRRYAEEKNYHRVDLSLSWPLRNGAMRHRGRYIRKEETACGINACIGWFTVS